MPTQPDSLTAQVQHAFSDELLCIGGKVTESYDDGARLFARGLLPNVADITPGDKHRAGIAIRMVHEQIVLHPYTFRLVCSNGAIFADSIGTVHLDVPTWADERMLLGAVRDAVRQCSNPEYFEQITSETYGTLSQAANLMIHMVALLRRLPKAHAGTYVQMITRQFEREDPSLFGLANAITATARDTRDPALKWELEGFAGALILTPPPQRPTSASRRRPLATVEA